MKMDYAQILAGKVALPARMECSLSDFALRIADAIDEEQKKLQCDNKLIALLCDAARLGWEQIEAHQPFKAVAPTATVLARDERSLLQALADLRKDYEEAAKPYIERLGEIRKSTPAGPLAVSLDQAREYITLSMGDHESAPELNGGCSTPAATDKGALQARIDELMLEYCPEDMTVEQMANYARHQRGANEPSQDRVTGQLGDCFELGQVWQSPRGTLWRVLNCVIRPGHRMQVVLQNKADHNRRQVRSWDEVTGWILTNHAPTQTQEVVQPDLPAGESP